ncbi:MAG: LCP family protein [Clostridium sp.]|uniref:LCP family protein n=1 Tax=Clostridium sp. TaxID=1506 RepID=UPI003F3439C3
MKKWGKILATIIIVILIVIIGVGIYTYNLLGKTKKVELNKDGLGINQAVNSEAEDAGVINIALFGKDEPKGTAGRSDAVMILTIDKKHNDVKLSSIMRDSYVEVKGHGKTKLTHAYAYGGPELAINTINTNFDLNIDKFISVNFTTLPEIIDKLGGVEIDIKPGDLKWINGYIDSLNSYNHTNVPHITELGPQLLNGTQATAYSRIRYSGGDQMRTERQRTVLEAVFSKIKVMPKTELPSILNELMPMLETNMSSTELIGLGMDIEKIDPKTMKQEMFPNDQSGHGEMIDGVYYQVFNKDMTTKNMHNFIFNS